jgi:hypothetical protein
MKSPTNIQELKLFCAALLKIYPNKQNFLEDTILLALEEAEDTSIFNAISLAISELRHEFSQETLNNLK